MSPRWWIMRRLLLKTTKPQIKFFFFELSLYFIFLILFLLPLCNKTFLWGFLFLVLREEQFQRCHWNWYWHSSIANWRPSMALEVTSGYWWQSSICSLLNPGNVLHIVGPMSSCLCSMKALFTPLTKKKKRSLLSFSW